MSSWLPCDPRNPVICGAGLAVLGGPRNVTAGGRLMRLFSTPYQEFTEVEVTLDPRHPLSQEGHANIFVNSLYDSGGGSGFYRGSARFPGQEVSIDVVPIPANTEWQEYLSPLCGIIGSALQLDWDGDLETESYTVYHASLANKSDSKAVSYYSVSDFIETTNLTNSETLTVFGSQGTLNAGWQFLVNLTYDGTVFNVDIYDETTSVRIAQELGFSAGDQVSFGVGMFLQVPTEWTTTGLTQFRILVTPRRQFRLEIPSDGNNFFKVNAQRNDGNGAVESLWVDHSIDMPPNPVENLEITWVSEGVIQVAFDMPSDSNIAGARIYHSWPENGDSIPQAVPQYDIAGTQSQALTQNITGLVPGEYGILVRSYDDEGIDDHSDDIRKVVLSATGVSMDGFSKPKSIRVKVTELGEVTATIATDGTEDTVYLYYDNATGTVDYDTAIDTLTKASDRDALTGKYSSVIAGLAAGTYVFACRAALLGVTELNTSLTDEVVVFDTALDAPSNLTVTEVS